MFNLIYEIEAIIPVKIGVTNLRMESFSEDGNNNQLNLNLDFLDKLRDKAS